MTFPIDPNELTPIGIIIVETALIIVGMFRGWLVPKGTFQTVIDAYKASADAANARADELQRTHITDQTTIATLTGYLEKLLIVGETTSTLLGAIPVPLNGDTGDESRGME